MGKTILIVLGFLAVAAMPAMAKEARCYTTDDGEYDCWFDMLDDRGSFEIAADGHPTFQLVIESPGVASGFSQFAVDGRFVPLPGLYTRSEEDGACWENVDTRTEICAW